MMTLVFVIIATDKTIQSDDNRVIRTPLFQACLQNLHLSVKSITIHFG